MSKFSTPTSDTPPGTNGAWFATTWKPRSYAPRRGVRYTATVQEPATITRRPATADTVPGSPRRLGLDLAQVARPPSDTATRCDCSRCFLGPRRSAGGQKILRSFRSLCPSVRRSQSRERLPSDGLQQNRLPVKFRKRFCPLVKLPTFREASTSIPIFCSDVTCSRVFGPENT
jgi:hypothetical protein